MGVVLNGHEAAKILRSSYFTVMRKAKAGEIPCFRFGGKVLFRQSALEDWIAAQEKMLNVKEAQM